MHVHPPKPLHGWKEFLNEIFVIVVGVLIALGFEQIVEELHWRHKVHEGEERLKVELDGAFKSAIFQVVLAPCKSAEFDVLADRVLKSGATLDPAPVEALSPRTAFIGDGGNVFNGTIRLLSGPVWESLKADGTTVHMPVREQRRLAIIYRQMEINEFLLRGSPPLSKLRYPMPLDPATRQALLSDIEANRRARFSMAGSAAQVAAAIRDIGYAPSPAAVDAYLADAAKIQIAQCRKQGHPLADWRKVLGVQLTLDQLGL